MSRYERGSMRERSLLAQELLTTALSTISSLMAAIAVVWGATILVKLLLIAINSNVRVVVTEGMIGVDTLILMNTSFIVEMLGAMLCGMISILTKQK